MVGKESVWLVADRRLSVGDAVASDDARKIAFLETPDGEAILGYAGIGRTPRLNEPCDWMNAVLRGENRPLEAALGVLADATRQEIPPLLKKISGSGRLGHTIVAPAFFNGRPAFYSIDLVMHADRQGYAFQFARHAAVTTPDGALVPPRVIVAGSGMDAIKGRPELRRLLVSLVRAHDRKAISSLAVADAFASVSHTVHLSGDSTVGPRSIVAWRYRKAGLFGGGGGHQFYTGTERDNSTTVLPTIANGMNVSGLIALLAPVFQRTIDAMAAGKPNPEIDRNEMDALTARVPMRPDRKLR